MPAKLQSILAATDLTRESNYAVERAAMLARLNALGGIGVMHVESGNAVEAIRAQARASQLIVIGASGRHALRDLLVGSTAQRLVARTQASVLVARNAPLDEYRRVLVALDFSESDDKAIAWARALAPRARLDLVHAFDTHVEGKLRYAGVGGEVIEAYRSRNREQALRLVGSVASRTPGPARPVVVPWPVAASLVEQARSARSDLIVVGRPGRSWLSNLLLQRVADLVLADAEADVLVVH